MQGSFCQTPMEQAALAFLPSAKTAEDVRETVTGDRRTCCCCVFHGCGGCQAMLPFVPLIMLYYSMNPRLGQRDDCPRNLAPMQDMQETQQAFVTQ